MIPVILATFASIPLLGLVTFVQLLYLESMRLRTRDLPSLKFFKETVEDRLGMDTEEEIDGEFGRITRTLVAEVEGQLS